MGEFKSPTGISALIRVQAVDYTRAENNTMRGYFGRVNADTMVHYRSYPCLAVYMQYISTCIDYTRHPNNYPDISYNIALCSNINGALAAGALETAPVSFTAQGSVGQIVVAVPQELDKLGIEERSTRIEFLHRGWCSYLGLPFRFRMRYPTANPAGGIPYDWLEDSIPEDWIANLNLPRDNEGPRDIEDFVIARTAPYDRLRSWARQMKRAT